MFPALKENKQRNIDEGVAVPFLFKLHFATSLIEDVAKFCSSSLRYICPTDESRMTTVPKPRSWEVKLYDEKMIKPGKTFCLIQKTPAFTTDGERCAEEDQKY